MRTLIAVAALTALAACGQSTTTTETTETPAESTTVAPPPVQAVTITEADARSRAEAQGYTHVTGLTQSPDGSWTATGTKDGQTTQLSVGPNGVSATTTPAPTP